MTPQEASTVLEVVREDEREVTAAERRFCELVFDGKSNQDAYLEAFEITNPNTASSNSSRLLREARVQRYLQQLREAAIGASAEKLIPWVSLLPRAQQIILATAEGRLRSRLQYEASLYLVNRVLGSPVAQAEISLLDQSRVSGAIKNLTRKLAEKAA